MYLFVLCLVVCFVNGVDLWGVPGRRALDRAAETARLIKFVQKIENFQEIPSKLRNNDEQNADIDDRDVFESMKLLQKNYDIGRKFNERKESANVQYISNPEMLEVYKNLPEENTEGHEDNSKQANTQRSYLQELERLEKLPMHMLRRSRRGDKEKTEKVSNDDSASDTDSSDDSNNAEEDEGDDVRRNTGDVQNLENPEITLKSAEAYDLVKPIIEQMLTEYKLNASLEKDLGAPPNVELKTVNKQNENVDQQIKKQHIKVYKSQGNSKLETKPDIVVRKEKLSELTVPQKKKVTVSISLNEQENKDAFLKKQSSSEENNAKDDRDLTNEKVFTSKKDLTDKSITIEDNKSEEKQDDSEKQKKKHGKKLKISTPESQKNKKNDSTEKKDIKITTQKYSKSKKNNNKKHASADKVESTVELDEKVVDWADYDAKKKTDKQLSKISAKIKSRKKEITWDKSDNEWDKKYERVDSSKISRKRKKEDYWDKKYDGENKKDKKGNWNKKDDNWNKEDDNWHKKKDEGWTKEEDWHKKDNWDKKDNWNKKDKWSKNDDNGNKHDDWDKKDDGRNKKDDWQKKDNWDKKDNWNKKDKFSKNDDNESKNDDWNKKYDGHIKKNDWNKKDNWNKQEGNWGKKDERNTKDESWNKQRDDDWNKKDNSWKKKDDKRDSDWDTKEERKSKKKDVWDNDGKAAKTRDNLKRDSSWDSVGVDKKSNSGWGNYDSFKNLQDKKYSNERDSGGGAQEKWRAPKRALKVQRKDSREDDAPKRSDYNDKPRKQGRIWTPIPFVGKKAVYD